MIIDQLMSPAIKVALSTYTVATHIVGGASKVFDMGTAKNQGLLSTPYGPGFVLNGRGATSGGAATATLQLVTDDNAALSSPTILFASATYTLAQMVKMDLFVPIPSSDLFERYLAWRIVVGTAVFTGGTLSIEYVANHREWRGYPSQGNR